MANIINFNDENKDKDQQENQQVSNAISPFVSSGGGQQQQAPQQPQSQAPNKAASSGQFTNIQKYLGANKGAGEQIAGSVQSKMNKNLQPGIRQQESEASKVAAGVQAANQTLDRGQGYQQELSAPGKIAQLPKAPGVAPQNSSVSDVNFDNFGKDLVDTSIYQKGQVQEKMSPGGIPTQAPQQLAQAQQEPQAFNPEAFVNDQNKLTDFTKIRLGQGVDEQALKTQAEKSQTLAGASENQAKDLFGRTRSAIGRTGLIGETFNRPNYTQGQQRLDSLFLTGAGKKGINAIQDTAKTNAVSAADRLMRSGQDVSKVGEVGTREQQLQQNLQNRANELETGYISSLDSLVPEINNMRGAERQKWQNNFDILTGKKQGTIDEDIFNELQLRNNERSFNVLNDPNLTLRQIADVSDRNAVNYRDVASQSDVDYYNKLAQLSKGTLDASGNFTGPAEDQLQLTKASDMARAAASKTGDASLRNKLDTALKSFLDKAKKSTVTGIGTDEGTSGMFGSGGTAVAQSGLNIADYLNSTGGINTKRDSVNNPTADMISSGAALTGLNPLGYIGAVPGVGSAINSITGADGGSGTAANYRSQNALIDSLNNYLTNAGYGNFITKTGNKNTDDLSRQTAGISQDWLDVSTRNRYGGVAGDPKDLTGARLEEYNQKKRENAAAQQRVQDEFNKRLGLNPKDANNPTLANLNLRDLMRKG